MNRPSGTADLLCFYQLHSPRWTTDILAHGFNHGSKVMTNKGFGDIFAICKNGDKTGIRMIKLINCESGKMPDTDSLAGR